jgi:hypothetical protein
MRPGATEGRLEFPITMKAAGLNCMVTAEPSARHDCRGSNREPFGASTILWLPGKVGERRRVFALSPREQPRQDCRGSKTGTRRRTRRPREKIRHAPAVSIASRSHGPLGQRALRGAAVSPSWWEPRASRQAVPTNHPLSIFSRWQPRFCRSRVASCR